MRPFAFALACNMVGAISTAGHIDGGPVHLLLAQTLLAGMLFLLWAARAQPRSTATWRHAASSQNRRPA